MRPDTSPTEGMLAGSGAVHKMCRVCTAAFSYNPLNLWPDYCPTCVHSTVRWRNAASEDGRSPVPSPGGQLPGGEAEPSLISNIAGAHGVKGTES